jgi:lipopolysaccharide biosynthesis glycosyltransferase
MNFVLSCDDGLSRMIPALLKSLYINHPTKTIDVYLLHYRISDEHIEAICNFAKRYNQQVYPIIVDIDKYKNFPLVSRWPVEAYFHALCHQDLPKEVDKIMYLDVDVIVASDIEDIYIILISAIIILLPTYYPVANLISSQNRISLRKRAMGNYSHLVDFY